MDNKNTFSFRLKKLRQELNISQREFAESIGVSAMAISTYESGSKSPSIETATKIVLKYNVSLDWLLGLSNKKNYDNCIETYSDIFNILLKLDSFINIRKIDDDETPFWTPQNYMYFSSEYIDACLSTLKKYKDLLNEQSIDNDIYQACIEKLLRETNIPIKKEDINQTTFFNLIAPTD